MKTENGVYLLIGKELKKVEDYNNEADARVVVVYEGIAVVISPKNLGKATFNDAIKIAKENNARLGNKVEWMIVDTLIKEAQEALELLGHDAIDPSWTSTECSSGNAWLYYSHGSLNLNYKYNSFNVRPLSSFPLDALKTK